MICRSILLTACALSAAALVAPVALAADVSGNAERGAFALQPVSYLQEQPAAKEPQPAVPAAQAQECCPEVETEKPFPLRFSLGYYMYTDYVWRAKNLSEYRREGREKLNHQMTTSISYVTQDFGAFGFDTFFEWYADQEKLNPFGGGQNLQEVDYKIWWEYFVKPVATDFTLSYTYDIFPNKAALNRQDRLRGNDNDDHTQYWTMYAVHNDAWMWDWLFPCNEGGVLNPSVLISHDFGALVGWWMEFGLSHTFKVPCVEHLTITPGWKLFADWHYWGKDVQLAGDQWSMVLAYNLSKALKLPKSVGDVILTGELYYNNAFGNLEDDGTLNDDLWGGTSIRWNWGG